MTVTVVALKAAGHGDGAGSVWLSPVESHVGVPVICTQPGALPTAQRGCRPPWLSPVESD